MADFFARLAARLLDEDTARLRPNLSTRFAPAPEIWPHAIAGSSPSAPAQAQRDVPSRAGAARAPPSVGCACQRPPGAPAATTRRACRRTTGRTLPPPPGHACRRGTGRGHVTVRCFARCDSPPHVTGKGKRTEATVPAALAGEGGDDSRPIPADPARKSASAAAPEPDSVLAPGKEPRPYPGPPPSRQPAAAAGEPAARQSAAGQPAAGQPRATGKTRTGGKLPGETLPGGDAEAGGPRPVPAAAGRPVPPPGQPPSAPGRLSFPPGRPRPRQGGPCHRRDGPCRQVKGLRLRRTPARRKRRHRQCSIRPARRIPRTACRPRPAVRVGAHRAESSPTAVRGGTGERPGPARGHWTGGGAPGSEADAGPAGDRRHCGQGRHARRAARRARDSAAGLAVRAAADLARTGPPSAGRAVAPAGP